MSLSRNTLQEICDFIAQSSVQLFGKKFIDCRLVLPVRLQLTLNKAEKGELKFLVISKFRLFLLAGKSIGGMKIERSFNVMALKSLQVVAAAGQKESSLNIGWEDRQQRACSLLVRSALNEPDSLGIALQVLAALKHYFPDIRQSLPKFVQLTPPSLYTLFSQLPRSTPDLPCRNFRRSYVAQCDLMEQQFRDEVLWDIERIYFTHDIHELRLEDFGHLGVKDHVAILACAQFSSYFTGILIDSIKMTAEHIDVLLNVVRRSHALKSLRLLNCQLSKEFTAQLAQALLQNHEVLPLETLDLSGNNLDDKKGIAQLAQALPRLQTMRTLVLSDCSLSEKSIHHLAYGLYNGLGMDQKFELKALVLSKNLLSKEYQEVNNELVNFVSLCQSLRHLDLSQTGFHIDKLWSALKLGSLKLERLKLGGCQISQSKKHKEEAIRAVRELFQSMINLEELDLGGTPLNAETLQQILVGLANNQCVKNLHLNLDGTLTTDKGCSAVMEKHIASCPIAFLSLRDNALEQEALKVLPSIGKIKGLRCLDVGGGNFQALKNNPKKCADVMGKVLQEVVALISNEDSCLEELSLADCRLGTQMSVILNALGVTQVKSLDFSNNEMGNFGARLLSKALQLNSSLKVLALDRNQISGDGFAELAHAMKINRSLVTLPFPMVDVADALQRPDRQRALSSLAEIEMHQERNRRGEMDGLNRACAQHLCHRLNSASLRYDISRDNERKIAFHEMQKCLVELGKDDCEGAQERVESLVGKILIELNFVAEEKQAEFKNRLREALLEKNVQIEREIGGSGDGGGVEQLKIQLKDDLERIAKRYVFESAWTRMESELNLLFSSPKGFRLCGPLSNISSIENSFHYSNVHHRNNRDNGDLSHRPNSILDDSFHRQFGAISLASGETLSSAADEEQVRIASLPKGSKLIHLAKNRPPPARRMKRTFEQSEDPTPPRVENSTVAVTKDNSNSVESSPSRAVSTGETITPSTTPPPLAPKRRGLVTVPPRLPPKPDSPPRQQTESPKSPGHQSNDIPQEVVMSAIANDEENK